MGLFSDFTDEVLGIDPNGGGIYNVFDDVLGIDPNAGGIFSLIEAVGIESDAQDVYSYVDCSWRMWIVLDAEEEGCE